MGHYLHVGRFQQFKKVSLSEIAAGVLGFFCWKKKTPPSTQKIKIIQFILFGVRLIAYFQSLESFNSFPKFLLRYTHSSTPLDDSTRPLDNSTNSTIHNPQRAGALVTSIILATVHPSSQSGRRLWVARKAPHLHEPNHEGNGRSTHNMVARSLTRSTASQPQVSTCESMEFADVPDVSNEERNDDLQYPCRRKTPWQCKPEFSTDKMVGDNKILTARCTWSRAVSVPAECQISDGCVGSLRGSHAACRNKPRSTVVVLTTALVSMNIDSVDRLPSKSRWLRRRSR